MMLNLSEEFIRLTDKRIETIITKHSSDPHNILTTLKLCIELVEKIHKANQFKQETKILVLCNLEFIKVIQELYKVLNINMNNVSFVTVCDIKADVARKFRVNVIKYESYKEFFKDNNLPKFDVVIGNPPYQGKKIGGGDTSGNAIWHKFVEKTFDISSDNAYISLIHPTDWRGENRKYKKVKNLLMNSDIFYLTPASTIFIDLKLAEVFVDYYLLHKCKTNIKTKINEMEIYIDKDTNIPNIKYCDNIFFNIMNKVCNGNNNFHFRKSFGGLRKLDENKPKGQYNFVYGVKFLKGEYNVYEYPHIHQDNLKVIIPANKWGIAYIDEGKLGIDDHIHYILCDNIKQAQYIKSVLESKIIRLFLKAFLNNKIAYNPMIFKKIKMENLGILNDEDLYKHFNLTKNEIQYIEDNIE